MCFIGSAASHRLAHTAPTIPNNDAHRYPATHLYAPAYIHAYTTADTHATSDADTPAESYSSPDDDASTLSHPRT